MRLSLTSKKLLIVTFTGEAMHNKNKNPSLNFLMHQPVESLDIYSFLLMKCL